MVGGICGICGLPVAVVGRVRIDDGRCIAAFLEGRCQDLGDGVYR